jgi:radical SAM superfamily enzyme YgiQ (UPF0313 family)
MKILLISINAKYIHTNNAVRLLKANSSFNPEILEYTIKDDIEDIARDINNYNADIIACSVYIWNVNTFIDLIPKLSLDNKKMILGGPEVSYDANYFLTNTAADFIIRGEGELVFEQLLLALHNKTSFETLSSLAYKKENEIIINPIEEIKDLSVLHLPYYFENDIPHIKNRVNYIESSRGCPYHCSYCLSSLEKTVRFFDTEEVKQAILYLLEHGAKTIKFLDRTFNANKSTLELLEFIIANDNLKTVFQFEITGDTLDVEIIKLLNKKARKGLFRFEIGIQSTNTATNELVDRHQNNEKLFNNVRLIEEGHVIDCHLDLIAGLPKENKESFINTFDEVFNLGSKELQLGFLKMLRGTKMRRESNLYDYKFKSTAPYEITENNVLSKEDIAEIHLVEHMLEIYHNKGYFRGNMLHLLLHKESPYLFLKEIGDDYLKHNYNMHGYQIEDVYQRLFPHLSEEETYLILQDYLERSKIKPKIFFENNITKQTKRLVFEKLAQLHTLNINTLYKHSAMIYFEDNFTVALYQNNIATLYKIKMD